MTVITYRFHPKYEHILCLSNGKIINTDKNAEVKGWINENGYRRIQISHNGATKSEYAHRITCQSYMGISDLTVNHIDGNKKNNDVKNLEYLSRSENTKHAFSIGLYPINKENGCLKFTDKDKHLMKKMRLLGVSAIDIAYLFHGSRQHITAILGNKIKNRRYINGK